MATLRNPTTGEEVELKRPNPVYFLFQKKARQTPSLQQQVQDLCMLNHVTKQQAMSLLWKGLDKEARAPFDEENKRQQQQLEEEIRRYERIGFVRFTKPRKKRTASGTVKHDGDAQQPQEASAGEHKGAEAAAAMQPEPEQRPKKKQKKAPKALVTPLVPKTKKSKTPATRTVAKSRRSTGTAKKPHLGMDIGFPISRVKSIAKAVPGAPKMAKDVPFVFCKATEYFLSLLAVQSANCAHNRKIEVWDIDQAAATMHETYFLQAVFNAELEEEEEEEEEGEEGKEEEVEEEEEEEEDDGGGEKEEKEEEEGGGDDDDGFEEDAIVADEPAADPFK